VNARRFAQHARLAAIALVVVVVARALPGAVAAQAASPPESARVLLSSELPPMRGDRLRATLVSVTYPPGGASTPHRHSCPLVGHVVDGALHSRVAGGVDTVYHAGESFREDANQAHVVSSNASELAPVTFFVWFVCDGDWPKMTPVASQGPR
jgi:quercetin dioxygenase-like cupin family protein